MICRIADFNVEFKNPSQYVEKFFLPFKADALPEVSFSVNADDIEQQRQRQTEVVSDGVLELTVFHRKLAGWAPLQGAFMLHSALIDVEGTGVAFAALSGTGKTTHMLLWKKLLGDKLTIVNGDKPIIRFIDGKPTAFGTPWQGKESLGDNISAPLTDICFIVRSATNSVEKVTSEEIFDKIFNQILLPDDVMGRVITLELVNNLLKKCNLWLIKCNMDIDAASTAYNAIIKSKEE